MATLADRRARRPVDVLVVDDDDAVRTSCTEILQAAGFTAVAAGDRDAALALLHEWDVGMILLDLTMRGNGASFVDSLVDPPPIVIVSALPLDADDRHSVDVKVSAQLEKPLSPHRLLTVVASVLRR